jgi:large subunit ribosomal protein L22
VNAEFVARHRFARITARKARYVADLIRGRSVNEALELLEFAPQRGASFYLKVVRSAVANASMDEDVNINRLVISECKADDGPLLNNRLRFRPGPQGRAMPFAKRLSHLTVKVREAEEVAAETESRPARRGRKAESTAQDSAGESSAEAPKKAKQDRKKKA